MQDARRDAWMARQGYRVLRFWDNEALLQTDAVLMVILQALAPDGPHPNPPPPAGEGVNQDNPPPPAGEGENQA